MLVGRLFGSVLQEETECFKTFTRCDEGVQVLEDHTQDGRRGRGGGQELGYQDGRKYAIVRQMWLMLDAMTLKDGAGSTQSDRQVDDLWSSVIYPSFTLSYCVLLMYGLNVLVSSLCHFLLVTYDGCTGVQRDFSRMF